MPRPRPSQRKSASQTDPIEVMIEAALLPGRYINWREEGDFVSGLEDAAEPVAALVETDPPRALRLTEAFLAGCYEKAEEGHWEWLYGHFVRGLWAAWLRARRAAGEDPDETARSFLERTENDPYGFADLDDDTLKAMDRAHLRALERATLAVFAEPAGGARVDAGAKTPARALEHARYRRESILRKIYAHRRDVEAYLKLCEASGGPDPDECLTLATMLKSKRRPAEALTWVDRGLALVRQRRSPLGEHRLTALRRELLARLGRADVVLAEVWRDYCEDPNRFTYEALMRLVPAPERPAWHAKAIDASSSGTDLAALLDLWLVTEEHARVVDRVRAMTDAQLAAVSHAINDRVAAHLDAPHPELAARVYRALALRVLAAKKSKVYGAALQNLADARRCYLAAGQGRLWDAVVAEVRAAHARKTSFIKDFERIAAAAGPTTEPSFLERARGRWFSGSEG
jgi:hypothetical protein